MRIRNFLEPLYKPWTRIGYLINATMIGKQSYMIAHGNTESAPYVLPVVALSLVFLATSDVLRHRRRLENNTYQNGF